MCEDIRVEGGVPHQEAAPDADRRTAFADAIKNKEEQSIQPRGR
jgi:hypothetical protein